MVRLTCIETEILHCADCFKLFNTVSLVLQIPDKIKRLPDAEEMIAPCANTSLPEKATAHSVCLFLLVGLGFCISIFFSFLLSSS